MVVGRSEWAMRETFLSVQLETEKLGLMVSEEEEDVRACIRVHLYFKYLHFY